MAAYSGISKDFTSIQAIAGDLIRGLPKDLPADSLAILICDSQIDSGALLAELGAALPVSLVGGTTFTYPLTQQGEEISAALTVLALEGMRYAVSVTPPLDEAVSARQMEEAYRACLRDLGGPPKLLAPFFPLVPGRNTDKFIHDLFALAGEVPVFGGVTTDDLDTTQAVVFAHGRAYPKSMVLLALGGDIRPVFAVGSQLTPLSQYGPAVTDSDGNIVRRVDDMTFCDYMRSIGIAPEQRVNGVDALVQYGPLPCQLRHKLQDDDGVPEIRCISYTNVEEGSVAFSSALPPGTKVNMGMIQKKDVVESSQRCLSHLLEQIQAGEAGGDYRYSVLLSVPCVARYFAMLGGENLEQSLLSRELPQSLAIGAYYGFCEIGPTMGAKGEIHNRSHNASIVMCAI